MNSLNHKLYSQAQDARIKYGLGLITREKALELIKPYEQKFNEVSIREAKKAKMKPRLFSAISFLR